MKTFINTFKTVLIIAFLFSSIATFAQRVGINEDGASPHTSAILDVNSNNKGLLIPRMTMLQRDAITSPATSLMIFQTNGDTGYYYYNGTVWTKLGAGGSGSNWATNGNNIYNTNTGSVGIGTDTPFANLHIKSSSAASMLLDGSAGNGASVALQTRMDSPSASGTFKMTASEYGSDKKIGFEYWDSNWDYVAIQQLMDITTGDTVVHAHGKVLSDDKYIGQGATFEYNKEEWQQEVVKVLTDKLYYGIHADVNSEEGVAIAAHGSNNVTGVLGYSEKGNGGYFYSDQGNALVTAYGNVGFGTDKPKANVHIKQYDAATLLVEGMTRANLTLRKTSVNNSTTHSYQEYDISTNNSGGLSMNEVSYTENLVDETASSGISKIAEFGTTAAIKAFGSVDVLGEVNNTDRTGYANLTPIAYGMIYYNAAAYAHTGNFTCVWNPSYQRYEITINNEDYLYWKYMTNVTAQGNSLKTAVAFSSAGKLTVTLYNAAGNKVQGSFNFSVFKP